MKYSKYLDLTVRHPFIQSLVWQHTSCDADKTERDVKEFVRERLDFVAYRPWDKLDLQSRNVFNREGSIPFAYAHQCYWTSVTYAVYFWVKGERTPRMRNVSWEYDGSVGEYTIQDVIEHIQNWYRQSWREFQGKSLHWEAVVKHSSAGGVSVSSVNLEVYPFPDNFWPGTVR